MNLEGLGSTPLQVALSTMIELFPNATELDDEHDPLATEQLGPSEKLGKEVGELAYCTVKVTATPKLSRVITSRFCSVHACLMV